MWIKLVSILFVLTILLEYGEAIMCHRCFSAMGGCGKDVVWRMFPWRNCGSSRFCVKVIKRENGEEKYTRECQNELLKSTYHRLRMPVRARHGYCLPGRKNDPWNPEQMTDSTLTYCFCDDVNGCNSAPTLTPRIVPIISLCSVLLFCARKLLL